MKERKAQGSSEYLSMLAVVLVIALILIGLISQFIPQAGSLTVSQSKAYWSSAQPFGISEAVQSKQSNISLVLQNNAPRELVLTSISLAFANGTSFSNNSSIIFTAGEKRVVVIYSEDLMPSCLGRAGQPYFYTVRFTYDDEPLEDKIQASDTPLAVICQ
jgi:hypothetical protein